MRRHGIEESRPLLESIHGIREVWVRQVPAGTRRISTLHVSSISMTHAMWWSAVGVGGLTYGVISYLIVSQATKSERKPQEDHPSRHGLDYEDVNFSSRGGETNLRGWYFLGQSDGPTVIFVHGIGSVRSGEGAVELASKLVRRGYSVLMFDLRGHGASEGEITSGGYYERLDLLGAFDFLLDRGISPRRIGVLGFSMGAGAALIAASEEPNLRALAVDSPYADISDLVAQEISRRSIIPGRMVPLFLPGAKLAARILFGIDLFGALVPVDAVRRLNYPILIIHGTGDTRIPNEHGALLHSSAPPGSTLWSARDVDHVGTFAAFPDEYVERLLAYYEERMPTKRSAQAPPCR